MVFSKEDWNAAMSSEVFRGYLAGQLAKEAMPKPQVQEPEVDKGEVLEQLSALEAHINSSPQLRTAFAALRKKFVEDPEYTAKVDPLFVKGVLMLDLEQD
jgi:hypothetical protein